MPVPETIICELNAQRWEGIRLPLNECRIQLCDFGVQQLFRPSIADDMVGGPCQDVVLNSQPDQREADQGGDLKVKCHLGFVVTKCLQQALLTLRGKAAPILDLMLEMNAGFDHLVRDAVQKFHLGPKAFMPIDQSL